MLPPALLLVTSLLASSAATPPVAASSGEAFDALARRAQVARDAGRTDEAMAAYRSALAQRPEWDEGWWYLGVVQYEGGRCADADQAFERFLALKPQAGPAWVMRGVCAFDRSEFTKAIEWLQKGVALGLGGNAELQRVARARLALALVKTGQFELAMTPLTVLARLSPDAPGLVEGAGLALLRLALLPSEIPEARRDVVRRLGRAGSLHLALRGDEAARAYEEVVAAYPDEPGVHYAYGVFLLRSGNDKGLAELRRAVELKPDDVLVHLEIAFELLLRGDAAAAKESATKAVALAPGLFAAHNALGRALVELGELDAGIHELEQAVSLAPESAEMHFALSRAYGKAGRADEAARERKVFAELEQRNRSAPADAQAPAPAHP